MSLIPNLRTPLACGLMFSLVVTGLFTLTTHQGHASSDALPHSLTVGVNESSEQAAPQAKTVDEATRTRVHEAFGKLPLSFEENRGQVDSVVKYVSRGTGYTLFLTPTEAVLALRKADERARNEKQLRVPFNPQPAIRNPHSAVLRMKLSGANHSPVVTGESELGVRTNYFKGNDPEKWQTGVAQYERVRYTQVYPGIDMIYYGEQQQLEYDFEVAPFADASRIALEFKGVTRVKIEKGTGDVLLKTASGEVRQHKPVAYQEAGGERREVESRYVMQGQRQVGIKLGEYDRTKPLVIDPVLSYSTYLGGGPNLGTSGADFGYGIAVDSSGIAYVTGVAYTPDFPTLYEYQTYQMAGWAAFVAKLDTNASGAASLLYSTYLGGNDDDIAYGIAVDPSGIAYVTGTTRSTNFPTFNEYQADQNGVNGDNDYDTFYDAFVTKLDTNASGAASLLYSTYLGGNKYDAAYGIAVDSSGNAYVTGYTESTNFPVLNQYQTHQASAAFVTKIDTNTAGAASLLYSTYLGGRNYDYGKGIAIDSSGNAYVTGYTRSGDFPTLNPYQTSHGGSTDAFVTKLNPNLSGAASLLYSTYLGGRNDDYGNGIAVDSSGNAYVTGSTTSTNFPLKNQYQTVQGIADAFVTKLDTNLSGAASLRYSTYLGGYINDYGNSIAVDASGNIYVTGSAASPDFPAFHQYQTVGDDYTFDGFVAKFNPNLSGAASLLYCTALDGNDYEESNSIAIDASGNAYVTGITLSTDFPLLHPYQSSVSGGDVFVTKLVNSYTISGRVTSDDGTGIGGVTLTLSGSQNSTILADSNGTYAVELAVGGNYTITPSQDGFTFLPSEQSFTNLQADQTNVNFTTQPATISGKVTVGSATGAGLAGVKVTLTGGSGFPPRSVNTAGNGSYTFGDVPTPGDYTIKASKAGYDLHPTQIVLYSVMTNQTDMNFIATLKSYTISGMVKLGAAGLAGVTLKLSSPTPAGFATRTATTNSSGAYSFANVPAGRSYIVTPTRIGYEFTPTNRSLANLSADRTGVNFAVTVYSITGRITRSGTTTGLSAVTVTLTSPTPTGFAARTVPTNSAGTYTFTNVPAGRNYTLKPGRSGFTFSPTTRSITNLSSNIPAGAATNFTGAGP